MGSIRNGVTLATLQFLMEHPGLAITGDDLADATGFTRDQCINAVPTLRYKYDIEQVARYTYRFIGRRASVHSQFVADKIPQDASLKPGLDSSHGKLFARQTVAPKPTSQLYEVVGATTQGNTIVRGEDGLLYKLEAL